MIGSILFHRVAFWFCLPVFTAAADQSIIPRQPQVTTGNKLCSVVHSLFDVEIVSDSEPSEDDFYHKDLVKDLLNRDLPNEDDIRMIQVKNVRKFVDATLSKNGKGPGDMDVNQCYLDPSKETDVPCKYARIYQISKLYYHDIINLYRYFKSNGRTRIPFDLYVHWIELGDFYLLHPDVTAVCPQPRRTKCERPADQPPDYGRLVFRPICYHRINVRGKPIQLKMDPPIIYEELYRNNSNTVVEDRWFRLAMHFSTTNGLKEEIRRLCSVKVQSDFCFMEPMVSIYTRYLYYKQSQQYNVMCRNLLRFSFEDLVLAKVRPVLVDFYSTAEKPGRSGKRPGVELKLVNDTFPALFEFIRNHKKNEIAATMNCLVYPLYISDSCTKVKDTTYKCLLEKVVNKIFHYIQVDKGDMKIIDTSIDFKDYVTYFKLDMFDDIETNTIELKSEMTSKSRTRAQKLLHKNFKGLRRFFRKIAKYSNETERNSIRYTKNRLEDFVAASEIDSKRVGIALDALINSVVILNTSNPDERKIKWAKTLLEALNPLAKLHKNTLIMESFDYLHETMLKIDQIKIPDCIKDHMYNLTSAVYRTKLLFFKDRELMSFVRTNLRVRSANESDLEFSHNKVLFLKNYEEYAPWMSKEKLKSIGRMLLNITFIACKRIKQTRLKKTSESFSDNLFFVYKAVEKALLTCREIEMDIERMIETFKETHDFQREVLKSYAAYLYARETRFAMIAMQSEVQKPAPSDRFQTFFLSLTVRLMIYFEQLIMIDRLCDLREYNEFGIRPIECSKFPPDMDIDVLVKHKKCVRKTKIVQIPISCKDDKSDKGSIDLDELLEGNEVIFQIPSVDWLTDNQWVSNKAASPLYLSRLEIYLPIISEGAREVTIRGHLVGNNKLHINDPNEYVIRPSVTLNTNYVEGRTAAANCRPSRSNLIKNPYQICPKPGWELPKICSGDHHHNLSANGVKTFGSIFGKWKVMLSGYEGKRLVLANGTSIKALIEICSENHGRNIQHRTFARFTSLTDEQFGNAKKSQILWGGVPLYNSRASSAASQRSDVEVNTDDDNETKACCVENQYYSKTLNGCVRCPEGFYRYLKGYSCLREN